MATLQTAPHWHRGAFARPCRRAAFDTYRMFMLIDFGKPVISTACSARMKGMHVP